MPLSTGCSAVRPALGAPLLAAQAPRAYLDLNRAADELDPAVIEGIARSAAQPAHLLGAGGDSPGGGGGAGDLSRQAAAGRGAGRLRRFWHPYHQACAG
jgi:N-formylglutamate amidohydrolase